MTNSSGHFARIEVAPDDETLLGESSLSTSPTDDARPSKPFPQDIAELLPPQPAHQLIEEQVARTPHNIALASAEIELTYAQLNVAANRFAHDLISAGVQQGELVGLFSDRGPHAMIAILGILKAGAAFLPLDPTYPAERIRMMLADARLRGVVTTGALSEVLESHLSARFDEATDAGEIVNPALWQINLETLLSEKRDTTCEAASRDDSPAVDVQADDLAYAIYTSGSTGRPKAALLAHRGVRNLCAAQQAMFPVNAESRVLQFASLCFDASISEIFVTLTCGATLCLVSEGDLAPSRLGQTLNDLRITVATIPPSVLNALEKSDLPWLRTLITAGEACPTRLVKHFAARHRVINAYGPTEATVCATMYACDPESDSPPPIGRAIIGCSALIMNEDQQECVPEETGEIYLGGIGLAIGYLNRPELTAEKFVELPQHGRLYRTGDLARRRADGVIEFVGRRDQQVKIRGVRIELGELEHTLQLHPYVREAVVTTEEINGTKRLVAHVAGGNGSPLVSHEVMSWLRSRVTSAMLPSEIHCRGEMPLLPNGKIDRKALHQAASKGSTAPEPTQVDDADTVRLAPRDRFELLVHDAFLATLEVSEVRLEDDFFVLGGDSLQAMDLLARLEAASGVMPSMAELMQAPTIAGLAQTIARRAAAREKSLEQANAAWSPLLRLTPHHATHPATARPLYCVHPGGGNSLCFLDLARRLADDRPVYGLTARGLEPGQVPLATVGELAAEYIAAIREHQPEGPYAIAGWSFGGIVAFEMASQLVQAGEEIEHLAVIDIGLLYSFGVLTTLFPEGDLALFELRRLPPDDQIREFTTRTAAAKLIPPGAPVELARRIYDTFMANVDAMMNYRPQHFAGRMTIYHADEPLVRLRRKLEDEWVPFCDKIENCTVAGNHLTMIHEPNVASLADALRERLAFQ